MAKCILVSQDSSREEGIISIIHSLQKFRHSTDEIFSTVEKRFDEYRIKIGALQKRMESLEMKLNNIKVCFLGDYEIWYNLQREYKSSKLSTFVICIACIAIDSLPLI